MHLRINIADLKVTGAVAFVAGCALLVRLLWLAEARRVLQ